MQVTKQWHTPAHCPRQTFHAAAAAVYIAARPPLGARGALRTHTPRAAAQRVRPKYLTAHLRTYQGKTRAKDDGPPLHNPRGPLRHAASKDVEGPQEVETGSREGKISGAEARSRRPAMLRRLHAIDATRVHHTRSWVVSFSSLRPFGPRRCSAQAHRRAPVLRALQVLRAAVAFVD